MIGQLAAAVLALACSIDATEIIAVLMTMSDAEVEELIKAALRRLQRADYRFTVEAAGYHWDVYSFRARGRRGMTALRIRDDGRLEVGFFKRGRYTPEQIQESLRSTHN